jgi:hypothetical protein
MDPTACSGERLPVNRQETSGWIDLQWVAGSSRLRRSSDLSNREKPLVRPSWTIDKQCERLDRAGHPETVRSAKLCSPFLAVSAPLVIAI